MSSGLQCSLGPLVGSAGFQGAQGSRPPTIRGPPPNLFSFIPRYDRCLRNLGRFRAQDVRTQISPTQSLSPNRFNFIYCYDRCLWDLERFMGQEARFQASHGTKTLPLTEGLPPNRSKNVGDSRPGPRPPMNEDPPINRGPPTKPFQFYLVLW